MNVPMTDDRAELIAQLRDEFDSWEILLASLSEEQITARRLPSNMAIKDVIAHLWAWQQLSIARLEAAQLDREPEFQMWPAELEEESENDVDRINAWIYETYASKSWSRVHQDWRHGFLRFLELGENLPDEDLLDARRYPWLNGYPLIRVLQGSYEHHYEHRRLDHNFEALLNSFRQPGGES